MPDSLINKGLNAASEPLLCVNNPGFDELSSWLNEAALVACRFDNNNRVVKHLGITSVLQVGPRWIILQPPLEVVRFQMHFGLSTVRRQLRFWNSAQPRRQIEPDEKQFYPHDK